MKRDLEKEIEADNSRLEIDKLEAKNKIDVTEREIKFFKTIAWILIYTGAAVLLLGIIPFIGVDVSKSIFNLYGDFVGGVVSSLWSLSGLLFIYLAFLGQRQQLLVQQLELKHSQIEIKATRLELSGQKEQMLIQNSTLKIQRFENTFFQLLQLQNEIVKFMDIKSSSDNNTIATGRDCFRYFYKKLKGVETKVRNDKLPAAMLARSVDEREAALRKIKLSYDETLKVYDDVFEKYLADLGHYFRNLYHIIKYVDSSDSVDKELYFKFIRAQLSAYELVFLFYNCLSENGIEEFKPLVEKNKLLKNLNWDLLLQKEHLSKYAPSAFGQEFLIV